MPIKEGYAKRKALRKESAKRKGYCVKCRQSRTMKGATKVKMKNGKPATKGKCPICKTNMFRIG